ncbi:AraC family transcriptional regulator [Serratia plymuthica]
MKATPFKKELDEKLRTMTESEMFYLSNPGQLSKKYNDISKITIKGKSVYYFEIPDLEINDFEITKNSRFTNVPEHTHSTLHMSYIYSGNCTFNIDGKQITLGQNDVCFIDKNVIRSKEYLNINDIVISIHFSHRFLTSNFLGKLSKHSFFTSFIVSALSENNQHENYIFFRTEGISKLRNLFLNLIEECFDKDIFTNETISSYLTLIMIELIRCHKHNPEPNIINISMENRSEILDIISYIESNFKSCTLDILAKEFGYNKKYISQLIKSKTGLNFKDIQTTQRLKYAAHLLETTHLSIQEISDNIGISNENFFYKKFRQRYGKTPKDFRNESSFGRIIEQKLI